MLIILAIVFLAAAVVFSMMGQGGGMAFTPIQVWAGVEFHTAAATSLFLIMVLSVSATLVYRRANKTDWRMALALESVTMTGGFAGAVFSGWLSGGALSGLFSVVALAAGWFMLRRPKAGASRLSDTPRRFYVWRRRIGQETFDVNLAVALPISLVAGLLAGMLGIGGGILKVPMMVLLLGVPMDIAVGSSALMVGLTAAGGFAGHVASGHWDWKTSLILAGAVFVGAQIGSRITLRIDKDKLKKGFGWFLLAVGLLMLIRIF